MSGLGEKLREVRGKQTLEELSRVLDLSKSYISELETGKKEPTRSVITKYLKTFTQLTPDDFFSGI